MLYFVAIIFLSFAGKQKKFVSMMKTSFSLSSLGTPPPSQHSNNSTQRPYHSLTKKRKQYDHETWLRCWSGSLPRDENKDDFWAALQPNYNYIMDNNLIESCTVC